MTTPRGLTGLPTSSQVEVNLPLNFTGPQKTDHPLAPAVYLHYYQLIQAELVPELGFRVPTPEPPDSALEKPKIRHSRIGSRGSRKRFTTDESNGKRTRKRWSPDDENVPKTAGKPKSFGKAKTFRSEIKLKTPKLDMTRNRSITLYPVSPQKERRGRLGKSSRNIKPSKSEETNKLDELRYRANTGISNSKRIENDTEHLAKGKTRFGVSKDNDKLEEEQTLTTISHSTPTMATPNVNHEPKPIQLEKPAPPVHLVKKIESKPVVNVKPKPVEVKEEEQRTHSSENTNVSDIKPKNDDSSKKVSFEQPKSSDISEKVKTSEDSEKAKPPENSEKSADLEEDMSKVNDDEKMKLQRERLSARMNKRRARRKKKRAKEKAEGKSAKGDKKNTKSENAKEKKQMTRALVDVKSEPAPVSKQMQGMTNQMAAMNNLMGAMGSPMGNTPMNPANSPMGALFPQMFQMMQLSNQAGNPGNSGQQGNYWEKMLMNLNQRIMMFESGNQAESRVPSQNWGKGNQRPVAHEKKMPEKGVRGRSKSVATIGSLPIKPEASPSGGKRKKGKRRYSRGRIKSLSGEMISTTIATSEEMVDKLELMVYFAAGKGQKKLKPLVLMVDKEWSFKKCMRKALAEMQKRPESRTNEDLMWINSYDVNTKEGIRDIRTDLRVLMGDHRIEHRGSGLNKKPSDYTDSFMNKIWIIPRKEVSISAILKRSKSVADLSTISENLPLNTVMSRAQTSRMKGHYPETFV